MMVPPLPESVPPPPVSALVPESVPGSLVPQPTAMPPPTTTTVMSRAMLKVSSGGHDNYATFSS